MLKTVLALGLTSALMAASSAHAKSAWEKFYRPVDRISSNALLSVTEPTEVISIGEDVDDCVAEMWARGYGVIGRSGYSGGSKPDGGLLKFAGKLHARYVCSYSKFLRTEHGSRLISTGGEKVTSTVNGEKVTGYTDYSWMSVPDARDTYSHQAAYFAPVPQRGLGLLTRPLTPAQHQEVGTNAGMLIFSIRRKSPAFEADIVPSDYLLSINGQQVFDSEGLLAAYEAAKGTDAQIVIFRRGERLTKTVRISPTGDW